LGIRTFAQSRLCDRSLKKSDCAIALFVALLKRAIVQVIKRVTKKRLSWFVRKSHNRSFQKSNCAIALFVALLKRVIKRATKRAIIQLLFSKERQQERLHSGSF